MSKYTTQLINIINMAPLNNSNISLQDKISNAISYIFNFETGIENKIHLIDIEKKFLYHYLMREIGFETVGLWKIFLQDRFLIKSTYYNELYKTINLDFNYLWDTNFKETYSGNKKLAENIKNLVSNSSLSDLNNLINNTSELIESDLPQTTLNGKDYATRSNQQTERSNSNQTQTAQNNQQGNSESNRDETEIYTIQRTGSTASHPVSELIVSYRNSIINVDEMFINEFNDLFLNLY